jgi:hypothetical protein
MLMWILRVYVGYTKCAFYHSLVPFIKVRYRHEHLSLSIQNGIFLKLKGYWVDAAWLKPRYLFTFSYLHGWLVLKTMWHVKRGVEWIMSDRIDTCEQVCNVGLQSWRMLVASHVTIGRSILRIWDRSVEDQKNRRNYCPGVCVCVIWNVVKHVL